MDTETRSLECIASDGTLDYGFSLGLSHNEFPPVKVPPALHQAAYTNPTILWRPDSASGDDSTRPCTSTVSSQGSQGDLPKPLVDLLSNIKHALRASFAERPPHTVQRLAELVLYPKAHYRTLPSYLRAVEKVVSVSSGANIFPLPLSSPLPGAMRGTVNGYGGSMLSDDAVVEDNASDGASLTPIPWLSNSSMLESFTTVPHHSPRSPRSLHDAADAPTFEEETPHARGPDVLGVEDLGPQKQLDTDTSILTEEVLTHSGTNASRDDDQDGGPSNVEKDADGDTDMSTESASAVGSGSESKSLEAKLEDEHHVSSADGGECETVSK
ncbi:hypothetical protein KEM56_007614 [Ascosphaera pollenicola]|nr:hypothetical protein KEM56_007614 [Ascosphaera pollenicola]